VFCVNSVKCKIVKSAMIIRQDAVNVILGIFLTPQIDTISVAPVIVNVESAIVVPYAFHANSALF